MPNVKRWADDLRAAFGAVEVDAGLRAQGYYACEGGRTIDTRKPMAGIWVAISPPLPKPAQPSPEARRGR